MSRVYTQEFDGSLREATDYRAARDRIESDQAASILVVTSEEDERFVQTYTSKSINAVSEISEETATELVQKYTDKYGNQD